MNYMDVSPKQLVSIATALIPFLEHDDAARADGIEHAETGGAAFEATGTTSGNWYGYKAAVDSGVVIRAKNPGYVEWSSADLIKVRRDDGGT